MTHTRHGHFIPGTADDDEMPQSVARCGGPLYCSRCSEDAREVKDKMGRRLNDRKVIINRYQWDTIADMLVGNVPARIQDWMDEKFTIRTTTYLPRPSEVPVLYVFFGFKQELTKWRLKHGIAIEDTILARDWEKMEGRRFRPVPVYHWGWMRNNIRHEIVLRARDIIYRAEAMYGSGPEMYRSYDV